jgi:hypothetical protein
LRTAVDRDSRRTIRDVVDGQQRLRTIIDFASGKLVLGAKAKEFKGDRYDTLDGELKDRFLSYKLTCEQLLNATDDDVLEVFVRINSYAIPVSEAELRNARFDTDFSELVKEVSQQLGSVWALGVISERERVRMVDQTFVAEAFAFLDRGVVAGAEADITRFYEQTKTRSAGDLPDAGLLKDVLDQTSELVGDLANEPLVQRPHFLMLLAAIMYARGVLPDGRIELQDIPPRDELLKDGQRVRDSLAVLNTALASDQPGARFQQFREARASTQRMKSRQTRFEHFCQALAGRYAD